MELEAAHRPDLAAGFIARFAEAAHDFDLYGALDFYLSYRAWVRGKVAALIASDGDLALMQRQGKREEARAQFALARAEEGKPLDRPFIIVMNGLPGSGKSVLARALGEVLAAPVISSDRVRKALADLPPTERGPTSLYEPDRTRETYGEMFRSAEVIVNSGRGVILDATFARRDSRARAAAIASTPAATFVLIESVCSDETALRKRLRGREQGASESDARERELELVRSDFEPVLATEAAVHVSVETTEDFGSCLVQAMIALRHAGIVPASERRRG
ncbi:MAG TPA: AAA family ATPase [Polyangia bacterium]|nr:AAA family ATPase [Polyangia bacterium]